jgi:hypothetical protein
MISDEVRLRTASLPTRKLADRSVKKKNATMSDSNSISIEMEKPRSKHSKKRSDESSDYEEEKREKTGEKPKSKGKSKEKPKQPSKRNSAKRNLSKSERFADRVALQMLRTPGERKEYHQKMFKTPKEAATAMSIAAQKKSEMPWYKIFVLGIGAGSTQTPLHALSSNFADFFARVMIAFGAQLAATLIAGSGLDAGTASMIGAAAFPVSAKTRFIHLQL